MTGFLGRGDNAALQTFGVVMEASPDALLALGGDGAVLAANAAAVRLFGLRQDAFTGLDHRLLIGEGFRDDVAQLLHQLLTQPDEHPAPLEITALRVDGTEFSVELAAALLPRQGSGEAPETAPGHAGSAGARVLLSVRGTAHRKTAHADLREAMSLLTATLESTADGILVIGNDGSVAGFNDQFLSMWRIPPELMEGDSEEPVMQVIVEQVADPVAFTARLGELQADRAAESHDVVDFRDGRTFERYSRPQRVGEKIVGRVWSFRDVTPRRKAQEQAHRAMMDLAVQAEKLRAMAFQDPLTGLANRAVFNDALAEALQEPRLKTVDVLLLDLDDFKEVNDILGHQAGDDMLIEVARRLRGCVSTADVVARLGGDEFVVLLTACPDADAIAACIVRCLHVPVTISGTVLRPSLSLGLASLGQDSVGPSELLRHADIAMYAAKAAGKNRFLRFHPDMMQALVQRTHMESGLQLAVPRGEITVDFQPIVSHRMGQVVQLEALARWDRGGERVPPSIFIPLAERTGLIGEIGAEVMATGMVQLAEWLSEDPSRSLAVNVSGVQLQEPDFAGSVLQLAEASGVAPYQLVVEVTESVFFDADCSLIQQLSTLRDAGARVALDDFGTGYSSLGRLQDLPVDTVKIDKTFVSMVRTGNERLPILSSMINMAHSLGLTVTAEGIETAAQADYLTALECDSLQGYLFSLPEPGDRLGQALHHAEEALIALKGRQAGRLPGLGGFLAARALRFDGRRLGGSGLRGPGRFPGGGSAGRAGGRGGSRYGAAVAAPATDQVDAGEQSREGSQHSCRVDEQHPGQGGQRRLVVVEQRQSAQHGDDPEQQDSREHGGGRKILVGHDFFQGFHALPPAWPGDGESRSMTSMGPGGCETAQDDTTSDEANAAARRRTDSGAETAGNPSPDRAGRIPYCLSAHSLEAPMRNVTAGLFHSVDGVVSEPFKFQFDSFDEELGQGLTRMMNTVDTVVLGRVSYQEWAGYWPNASADQDFAAFINPVEKFVASRTLTGPLEWQNSHLIDAPLEEFVAGLKERDGGEIAVCGSISVVRQLLFAGLLDSLQLMTHPVIAGSGRRLFEDGDPLTRLVLQDQSTTSKGNVLSTYGVRAQD